MLISGTKTDNEKKAKGARKTLGDISNIQQRQNKQAIQQVKQKFDSLTTKKYVENLTKVCSFFLLFRVMSEVSLVL